MNKGFFARLIVPGLIFQSTMIGGGYATGRELIEFFLRLGPQAGLIAMLVATISISIICAVAFEFSRSFSLFNYKSFVQKLLGSSWFLFELAYIALLILILSVIGAASGELVNSLLGLPAIMGTILLMCTVCVLVFLGSKAIEIFLSSWSVVLYIAYIILLIWCFVTFGEKISSNLSTINQPEFDAGALVSGLQFSGYNVISFMTVLFVVKGFVNRKDAITAGVLCGPLGMLPGLFLLIAMIAHYPSVVDEPLPINYLLAQLQSPKFIIIFQIVIFGTFIETGTALLHTINERISNSFNENTKPMPQKLRPAISLLLLITAIFIADAVGLVALIGQGYVYSAYAFLFIVILPLLTRGLWLITKPNIEDNGTEVLMKTERRY